MEMYLDLVRGTNSLAPEKDRADDERHELSVGSKQQQNEIKLVLGALKERDETLVGRMTKLFKSELDRQVKVLQRQYSTTLRNNQVQEKNLKDVERKLQSRMNAHDHDRKKHLQQLLLIRDLHFSSIGGSAKAIGLNSTHNEAAAILSDAIIETARSIVLENGGLPSEEKEEEPEPVRIVANHNELLKESAKCKEELGITQEKLAKAMMELDGRKAFLRSVQEDRDKARAQVQELEKQLVRTGFMLGADGSKVTIEEHMQMQQVLEDISQELEEVREENITQEEHINKLEDALRQSYRSIESLEHEKSKLQEAPPTPRMSRMKHRSNTGGIPGQLLRSGLVDESEIAENKVNDGPNTKEDNTLEVKEVAQNPTDQAKAVKKPEKPRKRRNTFTASMLRRGTKKKQSNLRVRSLSRTSVTSVAALGKTRGTCTPKGKWLGEEEFDRIEIELAFGKDQIASLQTRNTDLEKQLSNALEECHFAWEEAEKLEQERMAYEAHASFHESTAKDLRRQSKMIENSYKQQLDGLHNELRQVQEKTIIQRRHQEEETLLEEEDTSSLTSSEGMSKGTSTDSSAYQDIRQTTESKETQTASPCVLVSSSTNTEGPLSYSNTDNKVIDNANTSQPHEKLGGRSYVNSFIPQEGDVVDGLLESSSEMEHVVNDDSKGGVESIECGLLESSSSTDAEDNESNGFVQPSLVETPPNSKSKILTNDDSKRSDLQSTFSHEQSVSSENSSEQTSIESASYDQDKQSTIESSIHEGPRTVRESQSSNSTNDGRQTRAIKEASNSSEEELALEEVSLSDLRGSIHDEKRQTILSKYSRGTRAKTLVGEKLEQLKMEVSRRKETNLNEHLEHLKALEITIRGLRHELAAVRLQLSKQAAHETQDEIIIQTLVGTQQDHESHMKFVDMMLRERGRERLALNTLNAPNQLMTQDTFVENPFMCDTHPRLKQSCLSLNLELLSCASGVCVDDSKSPSVRAVRTIALDHVNTLEWYAGAMGTVNAHVLPQTVANPELRKRADLLEKLHVALRVRKEIVHRQAVYNWEQIFRCLSYQYCKVRSDFMGKIFLNQRPGKALSILRVSRLVTHRVKLRIEQLRYSRNILDPQRWSVLQIISKRVTDLAVLEGMCTTKVREPVQSFLPNDKVGDENFSAKVQQRVIVEAERQMKQAATERVRVAQQDLAIVPLRPPQQSPRVSRPNIRK